MKKALLLFVASLLIVPPVYGDETPIDRSLVPFKTVYCAGKMGSLARSETQKQILFSVREVIDSVSKRITDLLEKNKAPAWAKKNLQASVGQIENPPAVSVATSAKLNPFEIPNLMLSKKRLDGIEENIVNPSLDRIMTTDEIRGKDKILAQLDDIAKVSQQFHGAIQGKEFDSMVEGQLQKYDQIVKNTMKRSKWTRLHGLLRLLITAHYAYTVYHFGLQPPFLILAFFSYFGASGLYKLFWPAKTPTGDPQIRRTNAVDQYQIFDLIRTKLEKPDTDDYVHYAWGMPINGKFSQLLNNIQTPNAEFKDDLLEATKSLANGVYEADFRYLNLDTVFYYDKQTKEPVLLLITRNDKTFKPPTIKKSKKDRKKAEEKQQEWDLNPTPVTGR